jgi:hypothetical protein
MENVGIFYGHFEKFTTMWHVLWLLEYFVVIWNNLFGFGTFYQDKIWQP